MFITKDKIIEAAIIILNKDGLGGLSMRAIAKELNVKAASLYYHIQNKTELMGFIADYICKDVDLELSAESPRQRIIDISNAFRASLLRVQDSTEVFHKSIPNTPNRVKQIRVIIDSLKEMGIPKQNLLTAGNLLNNYILSFVADERLFTELNKDQDIPIELPFTKDLRFPNDYNQQFAYGLEVVLVGFERVDFMQNPYQK